MAARARKPEGAPDPAMDRVLEALREFSADHLDHRLQEDPGSPLAHLEAELNRMACSLQRRREEVVRAVELYCLHRFGSVLVHDLKNLASRLNFIPGNLRSADQDGEVVEACAATVEDTVERLQRLVSRFRDQRDAMVLKANADLNQVVQRAVDQSGAHDATRIRTEMFLDQLPRLHLDAPYLEEALVNILRNAVESMAGGGRLTIRSRQGEDPDGAAAAVISITDEGPGMSPEFIERELFTPFRSTKERGLGLGMFSCRETVELHRGRIVVDSAPGRGTTFHVYLPLALQEEPVA
jgi:signal transduction histidine kinase